MSLKENLLELLQKNSGEFLSGERAAEILSVSRTAVWKAVTVLKNEGYNIESVTNRGYRLSADTDILSACGINDYLGGQAKNYDISVLGTVTSTNALIKAEAAQNAPEGRIIIAAEQTAGRGRFGRSFFSPISKRRRSIRRTPARKGRNEIKKICRIYLCADSHAGSLSLNRAGRRHPRACRRSAGKQSAAHRQAGEPAQAAQHQKR